MNFRNWREIKFSLMGEKTNGLKFYCHDNIIFWLAYLLEESIDILSHILRILISENCDYSFRFLLRIQLQWPKKAHKL